MRSSRYLTAILSLIVVSSCPQPIGDRCGDKLPPCPNGTTCTEGRCRTDGVAGGTATGGGPASGGSAGGGGVVGADAGHDGGFGSDGGADAGNPPDAGRVLTVVDLALYVQSDGGVEEHPRMGEFVNALFIFAGRWASQASDGRRWWWSVRCRERACWSMGS